MNLLETFYIKFKSDAKDALKDSEAVEKQLDTLGGKEKKRNESEIKSSKELSKQRKETAKEIKEQTEATEKLGQSFVKTVEAAASAGAALFSFSAIKSGIQNVTDFNAALRTTASLTGQSSRSLAILGAAAEHAGGTQEGAVGQYVSLFDKFKAAGLPIDDPLVLIQRLQQKFAGKTPQAQAFLAGQIGISDPGWLALARQNPDQLKASIAQGQGTQLTEDQQKRLFDLRQSEKDALQEVDHWLGVLGSDLSTLIIPSLKSFGELLHKISSIPGGSEALATATTVGTGWIGWKLLKRIGRKLSGKAVPAASGTAAEGFSINQALGMSADAAAGASAATIGAIVVGTLAAAGSIAYHKEIADWVDNKLNGSSPSRSAASSNGTPLGIRNNNPGNLRPGGREASYGSPGAGIAALGNQLRRYGSRGWNTLDSIISHYAPSSENNTEAYIAAVARDTGFGRGQQLNLNDPATLQKLSAAIIKHENGYNPYSDSQIQSSIAAGQLAFGNTSSLGNFGSNRGGDRTISVKTGDITVQTQATDATGIASSIGGALQEQIKMAINSYDDGVLA